MKRNFIYSKKLVRTLLLKLEPYFLSHAERGEPFQIQDFLGGIHLCRHFVPTPFRLPIPIFNFGGEGEIRTLDGLPHAGFRNRCFRPLSHLSFQEGVLRHKGFPYYRMKYGTAIFHSHLSCGEATMHLSRGSLKTRPM